MSNISKTASSCCYGKSAVFDVSKGQLIYKIKKRQFFITGQSLSTSNTQSVCLVSASKTECYYKALTLWKKERLFLCVVGV